MDKIKHLLTISGTVNSKLLGKLEKKDEDYVLSRTQFLLLNPTFSQRIKAIVHNVEEHTKCICGTPLPYSPSKNLVFKEFCCMSCAKKGRNSQETTKKFLSTIEKNKKETIDVVNSAQILSKKDTIKFFTNNIDIFKNGGFKGVSLLKLNPDYYKSLFHYTTNEILNARIYELLYGKGKCLMCGKETKFLSLEKGFSKHCAEHGRVLGPKNKGLNAISTAVEKLQSFENFSEFELVHIPKKLNDSIRVKHKKCGETFNIELRNGKLQTYILRCGVCCNKSISSPELEIRDWLKSNNIQFTPQYKIGSKKIDIVIPSINLALEYNGMQNHSYGKSKHQRFNNHDTENKNCHLERIHLCESHKLNLMQIFDYEWLNQNKKDIWKSIISTKLNLNKTIHARKCSIKEITNNKIIENFLEENHIQGYCKSSIKLGLYFNDDLVSIMTFGSPRFNKNYEWELIRFCNKKYLNVVGGCNKLFKHFIKIYSPISVISYCDKRIFDGKIYEILGFNLIAESKPNYFYHKGVKIYSRYKHQKHKLHKILSNFDPKLTEKENMFNNGYRRIWDCGNKVFVWTK